MDNEPEPFLERLVREHRVTIAVVFPIVGAVTLVASATAPLPPILVFNSYLLLFGTLVMRLPLVAALAPLVTRRALTWIGVLVAYSYAIEWIGVRTGWPYGQFAYGVDLGPMVGGIPVGLPVFFIPLVVNAYLLAVILSRDWRAVLTVALGLVIAIDLVLDPAAVALGFWTYAAGGYYGVPGSNFLGWLLSGVVGIVAVDRAFARTPVRERLGQVEFALDDLVSFVLLWSTVNALYGQWLPVVIGLGLGLLLIGSGRVQIPARMLDQARRVP